MQTLFNRFLCQYCGSNRIVVKDISREILFRPNKCNMYMGGDNPYVTRFPINPYIMCESCQKRQDSKWMALWGNKFGTLNVELEDV